MQPIRHRRSAAAGAVLLTAITAVSAPRTARAQSPEQPAPGAPAAPSAAPTSAGVLAEDLFQQGLALLEKQDYAAACPKFAESYRLERGLGALLNLAVCHERQGRIATARAEFLESAAMARRHGDAEREALAQRHARELAPQVPYVVLRFVPAPPPGTRLALDGVTLLESAWSSPLTIDPGTHEAQAAAPGKKDIRVTFVAAATGDTKVVTLGPFVDDSAATPMATTPMGRDEGATAMSAQRTLAVASGAAGIVGLGVGSFFGLRTFSLKSDRGEHCDATNACDARGIELDAHARETALVSTVSFAAGAALVAVAVTLWVTAPPTARALDRAR